MRINLSKQGLLCSALAVVVCSSLAIAQPSGARSSRSGGFMSRITAGGMEPDYLLRDLRRFQESLELDEEQTMIVEQILREYDESFREATNASEEGMRSTFSNMRGQEDDPQAQEAQELRERMRTIREKMDSARQLNDEEGMQALQERLQKEMEEVRNAMNESRAAQWQSPQRQAAMEELALYVTDQLRLKRQLGTQFETDLVAVLNEEQLQFWPSLKRMLIRDRLLPKGRLSGETLDVMGLVEQQNFDDATLVTLLPAINEWDESVTAALVARDDHLVENQGALMAAFRTMEPSSGTSIMEAQARLSETVRLINDTAVEQISLALPNSEGAAFKQLSLERGYPRIYRSTRVERAYLSAMELEEIDPDILVSIVELYDALLVDLGLAREQILSATKRWESQEELDRMNRFTSRMSGIQSERAESPIRKAEENRTKIEESYLEQLRMLLTEAQIKILGGLEKRQPRENRGRDRWGRDGGFSGDREAFMNRFDKDGNGEISEDEREAIREHFRNGGGPPNRGGQSRGSRGQGGSSTQRGGGDRD
ncbi:MAG: hypothetical protein QGI78_06565 [Phycisphaerales bacterium]|jgi:hypothetical protein|nr:hypothetical protein [Phycisphaerales bacterium]